MFFLCASCDEGREPAAVESPSTDGMLCCSPEDANGASAAFAGFMRNLDADNVDADAQASSRVVVK